MKDGGLSYVNVETEHYLVPRDTSVEYGSGLDFSGDLQPEQSNPPMPGSDSTIDIPTTIGGVLLIVATVSTIIAFFVEAKFYCVLKCVKKACPSITR
ncbi:MAG: hypothetical protein ACR2PT_10070 [Endozoicomonas sp.]